MKRTLFALLALSCLLFLTGCPCEEDPASEDPPVNDISLLMEDIDSDFDRLHLDIQRIQHDLDKVAADPHLFATEASENFTITQRLDLDGEGYETAIKGSNSLIA